MARVKKRRVLGERQARRLERHFASRAISRKKRQWISRKIRYLVVHERRSVRQAAAIAYRMAGVARPRPRKHGKRRR